MFARRLDSPLLCPVNPNPAAPISIHHSSNKVHPPSIPLSLRGLLALSLPASLPRSVLTVLRALTPFWREERRERGSLSLSLTLLTCLSCEIDSSLSKGQTREGEGDRETGREGIRANTIERHLGNCNGLDSRGKKRRPRGVHILLIVLIRWECKQG